jgi:Cu/Ag efflux pump CusA
VSLPPGYDLTWGGQFESQPQAMQRLMIIVPMVGGLLSSTALTLFVLPIICSWVEERRARRHPR